jgi:dipeptidyl aminopeptidase/acylaminoacyl peptidase
VDWAPAWSPDGKYLYFASDRGGTMGIWRIPVNERTGRATGSPEPVAAGADVAMDLPHLSRDGRALVFRSKLAWVNPAAVAFDPSTGRIRGVTLLQHRTGTLIPSDVSPDGKWLALSSVLDRQQDLFLMRTDGTGLTRLTDDPARDWTPRFTADGKALTFWSNRGGQYDAWSIRPDGSGRTLLSSTGATATFPMFAPDGQRLSIGQIPSGGVLGTPPWPVTAERTRPLALEVPGGTVTPTYWSRDGRWLSGYVVDSAGEWVGFGVYDFTTGDVAWMPDFRHVVYFTDRGGLMQDVTTLERREIATRLPYPPDQLAGTVAAADGKALYYGAQQSEANIWLVRQASRNRRAPSSR